MSEGVLQARLVMASEPEDRLPAHRVLEGCSFTFPTNWAVKGISDQIWAGVGSEIAGGRKIGRFHCTSYWGTTKTVVGSLDGGWVFSGRIKGMA